MIRIQHVALMAAVITTASVGLASPALASTTVTVTGGGVSGGPVSDSTVTIVNSTGSSINFISNNLSTRGFVCSAANGGCGAPSGGETFDIAPGTVNETVTVTTVPAPGTTIGTFVITYAASGGGGGSSSSSSASSGPAPVVQQFGMPATGTCDDAQPEGLDLSGVPSGSWGISWAQWMNGGNGGAVCTRTLVYSTAQGAWTVN